MAEVGADLGADVPSCRAGFPGDGRHQSLFPTEALYEFGSTSKNFWKTWRATGAATTPPWPPFSIMAQTTRLGLS